MTVIGVAGGGIGGIALAIALKKRGISVKIYEGDPSFDSRRQGFGLTMQQAGHAIRELGIELREDAPSKSHYVFSSDGQIVGFFGRVFRREDGCCGEKDVSQAKKKDKLERWKPSPKIRFNIHIPRQTLREILLNEIGKEGIQWGQKIAKYTEIADHTEQGGRGVMLHFQDGSQEFVSALVGADGIHSIVRRQKIGDDLNYLGVIVILGILKNDHPLLPERIFETVDGTTRIYVMPFTSDTSMWQLSFPCDEAHAKVISKDPELLRKESLLRCQNWHAPVPELLTTTTPELICGYPVYDRQPISESQIRGDPASLVTLLGDAAHPMSPFRGQGANQALLDAVLLAECIHHAMQTESAAPSCDSPASLPPAQSDDNSRTPTAAALAAGFAAYERAMLQRSTCKVLASREAARAVHSDAVQGVAESLEVGGQVLATESIIQELRKCGVGAWSAGTAEGIDAAVRRVAGRVPSGCPSALHVRKMVTGRLESAAAPPARPAPAAREGTDRLCRLRRKKEEREMRKRLPKRSSELDAQSQGVLAGGGAEGKEVLWDLPEW